MLATRTRRARRTKGCCPLCHGPLVTGQYIALLPGLGWAHSACVARQIANPQPEGESPVKTATTAADRKPRCRYHGRRNDPCPNPVIDDDPEAVQLCPAHALRGAQLLAEHGAITIKFANVK